MTRIFFYFMIELYIVSLNWNEPQIFIGLILDCDHLNLELDEV